MGGGEVVRYLSKYGQEKISKIILVSAVTPYMLKTNDNPDGLPKETFDDFVNQVKSDRPGFLSNFGKTFYGINLINKPVSQSLLDWSLMLALKASPKATVDCIQSFSETDFRADLRDIHVPTLVIHGDSDKIVPIEISGEKTSAAIPGAEFKVYRGAPHGLFITEKDTLNQDIVDFVGTSTLSNQTSLDAAAEAISSASALPF